MQLPGHPARRTLAALLVLLASLAATPVRAGSPPVGNFENPANTTSALTSTYATYTVGVRFWLSVL